jgi:PDDEXK-like family of unknown function
VAWYDELLLSVPEAYTGPPARLRALVKVLSAEMATAFAAAGAVTPPWRSAGEGTSFLVYVPALQPYSTVVHLVSIGSPSHATGWCWASGD